MENAFNKELACSGLLDEISNIDDGEAIGRYVRNKGAVDEGNMTRKPVLFVVYQSGREGPQNGFRLALIKAGVTLDAVIERLKGEVQQKVAECIVVET